MFNILILIGQSSLPILSRNGIYMYWDSCWVNFFYKNFFFKKLLFIEDLLNFFFLEKCFSFFFKRGASFKKGKKKRKDEEVIKYFTKLYSNSWADPVKQQIEKKNYHRSRIWFVRYNEYVLISIFFYFFEKLQRKTKRRVDFKNSRPQTVFFKKRRGFNIKKKKFFLYKCCIF